MVYNGDKSDIENDTDHLASTLNRTHRLPLQT